MSIFQSALLDLFCRFLLSPALFIWTCLILIPFIAHLSHCSSVSSTIPFFVVNQRVSFIPVLLSTMICQCCLILIQMLLSFGFNVEMSRKMRHPFVSDQTWLLLLLKFICCALPIAHDSQAPSAPRGIVHCNFFCCVLSHHFIQMSEEPLCLFDVHLSCVGQNLCYLLCLVRDRYTAKIMPYWVFTLMSNLIL